MEQALINELIRLLCRSGGETFVGNFQKEINEDGVEEKWSSEEINEAVSYIKYINGYFGRDEAVAIITSLVSKYNIDPATLSMAQPATSEKIGVGEVQ